MPSTPGRDGTSHAGNSSRTDPTAKPGAMAVAPDGATTPLSITTAPAVSITAAAVAALIAGWIAAGSTGLLADPLRHALGWLALGVSVVAAWPGGRRAAVLGLAFAAMVALPVFLPTQPAHDVLVVAMIVALLAWAHAGISRRVLMSAATAVTMLGVFRLACESIPTAWALSSALGLGLGRLAGVISGRPLWIGESFGGVDVLVMMGVLCAAWLRWTAPPRVGRAVLAAVAILAGHLVYLVLVSRSTDLLAALPDLPPLPSADPADYRPPDWSWVAAMHRLVPWNLPAVAVAVQAAVAALMFRWATWLPPTTQPRAAVPHQSTVRSTAALGCVSRCVPRIPALLAVFIPIVTTLWLGASDLMGKKIVAYQEGYVEWAKPVHGNLSGRAAAGFGMLPTLVSSLGGKLKISAELSETDLAGADVVVLLDPVKPWPPERIERIEEFVRSGGSLLVAAEVMMDQADPRGCVNDVLKPTGMAVRYDVAVAENKDWQDACRTLAHPATLQSTLQPMLRHAAGRSGGFPAAGTGMGSSISVRWPARPILVGRWGWSDPGSDAMLTEIFRYDDGERLGDLVLAAERRLGKGTVAVLSPAYCLTNLGTVDSYPFTSRLLAHLTQVAGSPQAWWRQTLGLLACLVLVGLLVPRPEPIRLAVVAVLLAVSLSVSTTISCHAGRVVPGAPAASAAKIAYIDGSHMEAYADDPWSEDGLAALSMTLMGNGYLPLRLPELTAEQLERAAVLISIAPARAFSATERNVIREFIERGGVFICTVGAERAEAAGELLADFELAVPPSPVSPLQKTREPEPMGRYPDSFGRFVTEYLNAADYGAGDYKARVWVYSGWPIRCTAEAFDVLVHGYDDVPLAIARPIGKGWVVLVGDTGFAMNKNMGYAAGQLVPDARENADFWRWMLTRLTDKDDWIPPRLAPAATPGDVTQ